MALRFYVVRDRELDPDWPSRACAEIAMCDWEISAEWADFEDENTIERLAAARPVAQPASVEIDHGDLGLVRIEARHRADLEVYADEGTLPHELLPRARAGLVITLQGCAGPTEAVLCEAYQAIAIGLSADGLVRTPAGNWWDAKSQQWL